MTHDCERCRDTGNAPATGYQHVGYDELGCPECNDPDGPRCCSARPDESDDDRCSGCGHPIEEAEVRVEVTAIHALPGTTLWLGEGTDWTTGEAVVFGGDQRPLADIQSALARGESPTAIVPRWSVLSRRAVTHA